MVRNSMVPGVDGGQRGVAGREMDDKAEQTGDMHIQVLVRFAVSGSHQRKVLYRE
jgi:hypothetical protein